MPIVMLRGKRTSVRALVQGPTNGVHDGALLVQGALHFPQFLKPKGNASVIISTFAYLDANAVGLWVCANAQVVLLLDALREMPTTACKEKL